MEERVFVIIDGNNFYHRLKELVLKDLLSFDYEEFARKLVRERKLVSKKYYVGAVRTEMGNMKSFELWKNQRVLIGQLKKQGWKIGFGQLLKTEKRYHEKGVDVQIAVDLLVGAYENLYDIAILVSSDTDLLPAIEKVRQLKKKIEYVGFSHKPSFAMIKNSDVRRLLTKEDLKPFLSFN